MSESESRKTRLADLATVVATLHTKKNATLALYFFQGDEAKNKNIRPCCVNFAKLNKSRVVGNGLANQFCRCGLSLSLDNDGPLILQGLFFFEASEILVGIAAIKEENAQAHLVDHEPSSFRVLEFFWRAERRINFPNSQRKTKQKTQTC